MTGPGIFVTWILLLVACVTAYRKDDFVEIGRLQHSGGLCVHPYRGHYNPGADTRLVLHGCGVGGNAARITFGLTTSGRIVHMSSGKCIHTRGGRSHPADDTGLVLHHAGCWQSIHTRRDIQWQFTRRGSLQQHSSNKCVHPYRGRSVPDRDTSLVVHHVCDLDRIKFRFT